LQESEVYAALSCDLGFPQNADSDSLLGWSCPEGQVSKPRDERQKDLFGPALEQIIDMAHPLVRLAQ
jgi:IS5 family transposase